MSYSIYRIVNLIDGKCYVGVTSRRVADRLHEHLDFARKPRRRRGRTSTIQRAILIHGPDAFMVQTLEIVRTAAEAIERERFWIRRYGSQQRDRGYNRAPGGEGVV